MNGAGNEGMLRARGLRKDYGRGGGLVRAVDEVDLEVAAGETVAVMGPSGCGKSTLLHLLGGLDRPTAGEIWLAGQSLGRLTERALARLRRDAVGFVFQAFHLMDELTAVENVELPALLAGRSPRADAGDRHPRPADRRHRRPDDLDARRGVRRRDQAHRRDHRQPRSPRWAG